MPRLPGHVYLGPGNSYPNVPPVDNDDAIAAEHDRRYSNAVSSGEIRRADRLAIGDFAATYIRDPTNWHAAVGGIGLSAKYIFETASGVLYPRMPVLGKRGNTIESAQLGSLSLPATSVPAKRVATMSAVAEVQIDNPTSMDIGDSDGSGRSAGSGGVGSQLAGAGLGGFSRGNRLSWRFKKSWILSSFSYNFKRGTEFRGAGDNHKKAFTATPYVHLPVQAPSLYMSPDDFLTLSPGATAQSCRVRVTPLGFRTPFATQESNSTYANSQMFVLGVSGTGLNQVFDLATCGYNSSAGDPATITSVTAQGELTAILYSTDFAQIPATYGVPRHLNSYAMIAENMSDRRGSSSGNTMHLGQYMNSWTFNDHLGKPVVDYSYTFKYAPLVLKADSFKYSTFVNTSPVMYPGFAPHINIVEPGSDEVLTSKTVAGDARKNKPFAGDNFYGGSLEKGWFMAPHIGGGQVTAVQPSLHFGVLPTLSSDMGSANPKFASVNAYFRVDCELVVYADTETTGFGKEGEDGGFYPVNQIPIAGVPVDVTKGPFDINKVQVSRNGFVSAWDANTLLKPAKAEPPAAVRVVKPAQH